MEQEKTDESKRLKNIVMIIVTIVIIAVAVGVVVNKDGPSHKRNTEMYNGFKQFKPLSKPKRPKWGSWFE